MSTHAWLVLALYCAVLLALALPMGRYIAHVMAGRLRFAGRVEGLLYRPCGVRPEAEMGWLHYTLALLLFNGLGTSAVYALQRLQAVLPLNPQGLAGVSADSAFNSAISFTTNTNWQGYGGESTMSYLTQMLGLTVQNFLSAATGIVVVIALIRGLARHSAKSIGNAWVDLTRVTLWILLPLSLLIALVQVQQGGIQNFSAYQDVRTLEAVAYQAPKLGPDGQPLKNDKGEPVLEDKTATTQTLAMGPASSQVAIKMLGTNGGGFFNANSAHPYENPTPLSNFVQMLAVLLIPAGLCFTFGRMVADPRQGWTVFAAMALLFVAGVLAANHFEQQGNPRLEALGVSQDQTALQAGGNMEGKETRFGIAESALFATITTDASCGAVNGMHDSYTPLGGLVPLVNMQLGEVIFGGVGTGLYGMLVFAILAVFIAGLMIGRTPEYLGKKIEAHEMKMASIAILVTPLLVLLGTAVGVMADVGRAGVANPGAHGFSEILYAFTSAANNNGSAFAGLSTNTPFYNVMLGMAMWFGRFGVIHVPQLGWEVLAPGLLVTLLAGALGGLFARLLVASTAGTADRFSAWRRRYPLRFAAGCALAVAVIGAATHGDTFGSGYEHTRALLEGGRENTPVLFVLLKFAATWLSVWAGVPGGIFAPSLSIGAGVGSDVAWLVQQPALAPALIAMGMAAFLAAVTQAPITAFIIVMEMVDGHAMVLSLMAAAMIASLVSRQISRPLYEALAVLQLKRLDVASDAVPAQAGEVKVPLEQPATPRHETWP